MNEQLANQLTQIGLHEREAKVYLALLELGESGVSAISKKSGIQRTYVYDVLKALLERDLVIEYEKDGKKTYLANGPETIETMLKQRVAQFGEILPTLLSLNNMAPHKPKIRYFEREESIKFIHDVIDRRTVETVAVSAHATVLHTALPLSTLKNITLRKDTADAAQATIFIGSRLVIFLSSGEASTYAVSIEDKVIASTLLTIISSLM